MAAALEKPAIVESIIQETAKTSIAMQQFTPIRMGARQHRFPLLSALPTAGWVGESATDPDGVKPTTNIAWEDKYITAAEIACIVPIHENVFEDSSIKIWDTVTPLVTEEFGRVLDLATLFGVNKPNTWDDEAIVPAAIAAGNVVKENEGNDPGDDFNLLFGKVEDHGFNVDEIWATNALKTKLRGMRSADGIPIYVDSIREDNTVGSVYGVPVVTSANGAWDKTKALAIAGSKRNAFIGIRSDIQMKLLTEATVGGVNLAERDMIAMRFKFRVGFATTVPFNREHGFNRYPFAVLQPDTAAPRKTAGK
jgi:HK97 family phage major capsid protein